MLNQNNGLPQNVCFILIIKDQKLICQYKESKRFGGGIIGPLSLRYDPTHHGKFSSDELLKATAKKYFKGDNTDIVQEMKTITFPCDNINCYFSYADMTDKKIPMINGIFSYFRASDIVNRNSIQIAGKGAVRIVETLKIGLSQLPIGIRKGLRLKVKAFY